MRTAIARRLAAVGVTIMLAGALAVVASGTTGAYFSDSKAGSVGGTIGSVKISTAGTQGPGVDALGFTFTDLAPGVAQTATISFSNTGTLPQDVYLTFPDAQALHAINNLGSYGEAHIVDGGGTKLFDSTNLSDGRMKADGTGNCGALAPTGCWPIPASLKVASHLAPGAGGSVSVSFNYAAKLTGTGGGAFNSYPLGNGEGSKADLDGVANSHDGLPVTLVATQVGQQP